MFMQILLHTPIWVWLMLCALVALGISQWRDRRVRRGQIVILPLALLVLGLWSMAPGFLAQPLTALAWLASFGAALAWARRRAVPTTARWLAAEQRLHLPGSGLPLLIILIIFTLRYATGVSLALHPEWRGLLTVQLPLALSFGALSGLFMGRALALWALTRARRTGAVARPAHTRISV